MPTSTKLSEYEIQANTFLATFGLDFRVVFVGMDCPPFCKDMQAGKDLDLVNVYPRKSHIHGKHYRCTISSKGRGHVSFDFWNSYRDSEENAYNFGSEREDSPDGMLTGPRDNVYWDKYRNGKPDTGSMIRPKGKRKTPTAYDILACITKTDPGTFENFCPEFGFDEDSRQAESVYHALRKEWIKVENFFTQTEIEALQGIQ